MTTQIRKAKEPYIYHNPTNVTQYCGACKKPFVDGQIVIPKARYTNRIPKTVHRECYVDAHNKPVFGANCI